MKNLILFFTLLLISVSALADDGWHLAVGLAVHDPAYDWHQHRIGPPSTQFPAKDYYADNPLGIVKFHYQSGKWDVGILHISSIPNTHDDHGTTALYLTVDVF